MNESKIRANAGLNDRNTAQLLIVIDSIHPIIWRRVLVPWVWHLGQLHHVIQAAFGWCEMHSYEFQIGGLRYGDQNFAPDHDMSPRLCDEVTVRLCDFDRLPGTRFGYHYDFGDRWQHTITIERIVALEPTLRHATCIGGERARPPEDVGGAEGYASFLEAVKNPKHPNHASLIKWADCNFDPNWFDRDFTNKLLRNAFNQRTKRYRAQPRVKRRIPDEPTTPGSS
jgi:hypothetical protein